MSTFTVVDNKNISELAKLGSVAGLAWTRVTTTASITQTAHGYLVGDLFAVTATSDAAAITTGAKTVLGVTNANVFTVTCLNAGAASGTVTANPRGDDYVINGGYLTVDQHSRYGTNQFTHSALGDITMSATLGGTIEFNSTKVRLIPYNTGTGNVPALGTTISKGSASGILLGVYSALNVAPTAAGAAMPASGYILIRQWNSVAYTSGALTGIGASATAADRAGWLEIVGLESSTITDNRLNLFKVRGDYYDFLGATTDGARATTYQIPSNGSVVYCPGVEVETGTGTGVYDFYHCAGSRTALLANVATDEVRGKWCWISTAGLVRFGHDGTNSTGGFIPPSGRKIRVSNIFFMIATQAAPETNVLPNATLATRPEFATTGGGVIDIDKASMNWYCNFAQAFSVALTNTSTFSAIVLSECASPIAWSNVNVGQEAANTQIALTMSLNFAGGTMDKCGWTRAAQAGSGTYITTWSDCSGFTITNQRNHSLTKAGNATSGTSLLTRVANSTWNDTTLGGGQVWHVTCTDVIFTNSIYYDHPADTTGTAIPFYAFSVSTGCIRCKQDGVTFGGLTMVQPYSGILNVLAAGCTDGKLRNIGTAASPLDAGGAQANATWTRSTTTATATKTAHGLKVNDIVYCIISSDIAAIVVGAKTVASVPTADTYTFTCLNAGAASGTLVYAPTMMASLVVLANGAAANGLDIQRCYTPHTRGVLMTGDNSSKNVTFESVEGSPWQALLAPELNATFKMVTASPALTAQTSCYGTHWFDYYTAGVPVNTAGVAWTRSTTTATATSVGHNLRTGSLINVTVTSDASAIVLGQKTITATTADAFTFTCLNAGGASGTLTFEPITSYIAIQMNEASTETASQVTLANGAAFTSAGGLYMPTIGMTATFETPYYLKGHDGFQNIVATMAGGTIGNYEYGALIDKNDGAGWVLLPAQTPLPTASPAGNWQGVCSSSNGSILTACGGGETHRSTNGGLSWSQLISAPVGATRLKCSADGMSLVTGWYGDYLYTSSDGGANWTQRTSAGVRSWYDFCSSEDGLKLAATATTNVVYTSVDGGANWTARTVTGAGGFYAVACSSDGLTIYAYDQTTTSHFFKSTDGGVNWSEITSATFGDTRIACSSDGVNLVASVYGGDIFTSTNGGTSWTTRTLTGDWEAVASSGDGQRLMVAGYTSGWVYTTKDAGVSWTQQTSSGAREWHGVACSLDGLRIVATDLFGGVGYIYCSSPTDADGFPSYSSALFKEALANVTDADSDLGFKLKLRIKTTTTNATAITSFRIPTLNSSTSRAATYPLDVVPVTIIVKDSATLDPVENARVRITTDVGGFVVLEGLTDASGILTGTTEYASHDITGTVRRATVADGTLYKPGSIAGTTTADGFSTTVLMIADE